MSNLLTSQILEDGDRNAIVKIVGVLDSSDQSRVVVVNPASYAPVPEKFRVDWCWFSVEPELTVYLYWEGSSPKLMMTLNGTNEVDYKRFGGLQNNATTPNGNISLATEGWGAGTQSFTLILWMVKQGQTVDVSGGPFILEENGGVLLQENGAGILLG